MVIPHKINIIELQRCAEIIASKLIAYDEDVLKRFENYDIEPSICNAFRDAQKLVAKENGFSHWSGLLLSRDHSQATIQERAMLFSHYACLEYWGNDDVKRRMQAEALLSDTPQIVDNDIYAAAAANDFEALKKQLIVDERLATAIGGPRGWPPILYVCYSRIKENLPHTDSLVLLRLLLDHGADANAHIICPDLGGWKWSGITGAMGEGEHGLLQQPPHSRARELVELLLNNGADPNDAQGLYNTMFSGKDDWLELLLQYGLNGEDCVTPGKQLKTLDYQLSQAVKRGLAIRVELLIDHGADVMTADVYNGKSVYENALLEGYPQIASRLVDKGAKPVSLSIEDQFKSAYMVGDKETSERLLSENPELLKPGQLNQAVRNQTGVSLLIDLGSDPNQPDSMGGRVALHEAAWLGEMDVIKILIDAGADTDIRESAHNTSPIGFADHAGQVIARDYLLNYSCDIETLIFHGCADRLKSFLEENPEYIDKRLNSSGHKPIHVINKKADETIGVLLSFGADLNEVTDAGETPLEIANKNKNKEAIDALILHGANNEKG